MSQAGRTPSPSGESPAIRVEDEVELTADVSGLPGTVHPMGTRGVVTEVGDDGSCSVQLRLRDPDAPEGHRWRRAELAPGQFRRVRKGRKTQAHEAWHRFLAARDEDDPSAVLDAAVTFLRAGGTPPAQGELMDTLVEAAETLAEGDAADRARACRALQVATSAVHIYQERAGVLLDRALELADTVEGARGDLLRAEVLFRLSRRDRSLHDGEEAERRLREVVRLLSEREDEEARSLRGVAVAELTDDRIVY